MSSDPGTFATLSLLAEASPAAVTALAKRAVVTQYPRGGVIFLAGTMPRGWYIVLEGRVRMARKSAGRNWVIHSVAAGGTMGEGAFFGEEPHPATGIAAEPTRCALFDRPTLEAAIAECPEISFMITRRLALRFGG